MLSQYPNGIQYGILQAGESTLSEIQYISVLVFLIIKVLTIYTFGTKSPASAICERRPRPRIHPSRAIADDRARQRRGQRAQEPIQDAEEEESVGVNDFGVT